MAPMRAVLVNAEWELERRRRLGLDKQDERWAGEWRLVNPPRRWHARLNSDMFRVLAPRAEARGLSPYCESTGVFEDVDTNWRVPDQVYARPDQEIDEGVAGAELVVGIRSPVTTTTPSSRSTPSGGSPRSSSSTRTGGSSCTGWTRAAPTSSSTTPPRPRWG